MSARHRRTSLIVAIAMLLLASKQLSAQELQVSLQNAGELKNHISEWSKTSIRKLIVAGPVNGEDMSLIRWMAGNENGKLAVLDLSAARMVGDDTVLGTYPHSVSGSYGDYDQMQNVIMQDGKVCAGLFFEMGNLTSISLPNSVTFIGEKALYGCKNLETVTIGNSTATIANEVFAQCYNLTTVTFPSAVISVGSEAFNGCTALVKPITEDIQAWAAINFADELASPIWYAHKLYTDEMTAPKSIVLSEQCQTIGSYAFANNTYITSLTTP